MHSFCVIKCIVGHLNLKLGSHTFFLSLEAPFQVRFLFENSSEAQWSEREKHFPPPKSVHALLKTP